MMQMKTVSKHTRTCKSTSKSGCRTCKLRKVKCDEGFPVCLRCQTAGRVCEGYGIWGGGNGVHEERQPPAGSGTGSPASTTTLATRPAAGLALWLSSSDEREHLDWFRYRTATKLPGSFRSGFWSILLLQAGFSEPAVLHAIIALSSVQKGGILQIKPQNEGRAVPDEQERFILRHYVKAIRSLHPHFQARDQAAFRVALISCIVFVSLDFLRGHFTTGLVHLQNGLRLLEEAQEILTSTREPFCLHPGRESVNDWIIETFTRLHLQVQLFRQPHHQPCFLFDPVFSSAPVRSFHSLKAAWHELDWLFNAIFHLSRQAHVCERAKTSSQPLYDHRHGVEIGLLRWLRAYEVFMETLPDDLSLEEQRGYRIIGVYHTLATIMVAVCLCPGDEEAFDAHTDLFIHLLSQLEEIRALAEEVFVAPPGHLIYMAGSIVDMGCLAPLYYTAIKCRVHHVRLKAIRQLESTFHREGIWDAKITARVARKVVKIEERGFYDGTCVPDVAMADKSLSVIDLCEQEHSMPRLPGSYRLRDAEMVLAGDPTDRVLLYCTLRQGDADRRVPIAQYHLASQRWVDLVGP
ncbi:hypothetical protein DL546_009732 [Coniochaeta pulveracea]|uniref:Zn(2)-C6 fungal-type domain-containing protein n=1 Tax=Coniochaeta pulveracea TaxID=177199 RepID=A0A420YMZ1_9PEZI|nr:hypothetical protein DL546_009732 [Coniochaeta pulveracea]